MTSVNYASRLLTLVLCFWMATYAWCLPGLGSDQLQRRTYPNFPDKPDSCPICAKDYASIQGCAEAAPVFENFTNVIFNPGAFVDTIRCACADTFKAVFPQCVDCFIETGQEDIIMGHNLPAVVEGIRKVCALASTLLGNVTETNNATANAPPASAGAVSVRMDNVSFLPIPIALALALSALAVL
ncbi:hypothetical protein DFP72DRAFT_912623 [Ephemerocybe angulata]|uniref:Uncharacterized protein n=1 Tax=Ephemerocybe angulata TaxID=980116 RepID=A0A8H6M1F4_9AGAR|nr:hypothetical protein DFP72DRAFT_912623 [Tulosesus angulatus]